MKKLVNNKIWTKVLMILLIVLLFQFIIATPVVNAADDGIGGKLLSPVMSLLVTIGDAIVDIIHESVMGQTQSLIPIDMSTTWWENWGGVVIGILAGLACIAVIVLTCGLAALALSVVGITATVSIGVGTVIVSATVGICVGVWYDKNCLPQDLYLPAYSISAEEIFKGKILLFDVDFFNPQNYEIYAETGTGKIYKVSELTQAQLDRRIKEDGLKNYFYYNSDGKQVPTSKQNTALEIRGVVSQWYNAIRNICLVLMMSVLLYIGIRMLLSTAAQDKAKYKQMIVDWVVGMCLLFFMHYIMAFSVSIVKQFTEVIDSAYDDEMNTKYAVVMEDDEAEKFSEALEEMGMEDVYQDGYITWPTNLMGKLRLQGQLETGSAQFVGYALCFIVLVFYTIFFAFTYLKRVVYMAFLTMIAPLVALTYPIDKINDGQAQGFNKWLKEYIFNLLIQPLHLLLYTILVLSAFEFAGVNTVYMLVAIAFLIPAEKILRSFFGFEKSETAGSLAGAAVGAGLVSSGMNKLLGKGGPHGGGKGPGGNLKEGKDNSRTQKKIGFQSNLDKFAALGGGSSQQGGGTVRQSLGIGNGAGPGTVTGMGASIGAGGNPRNGRRNPNAPYSVTGTLARAVGNTRPGRAVRRFTNKAGTKVGNLALGAMNRAGNAKRTLKNKPAIQAMGRGLGAVGRGAKWLGNSREGRFIRRQIGGVARMGGYVGARLVGKGANMLSRVPRYAANAAVGALTGSIGLAAGLASGDFGNTVQYTAAAATGGAALANRFTNYQSDGEFARNLKEQYYGDRFEEHEREAYIREWKKNKENIELLEKNLGKQEAKEALRRNGNVETYIRNGYDNVEDIIAMEQMIKDNNVEVYDTEQAMGVKMFADQAGDTSRMKTKDQKEWIQTFQEGYKGTGNFTDEQADKLGKETMQKTIRFWEKKHDLKK